MRSLWTVMVAIVAALALGACGGDDGGGTLSKDEYKKEAQSISDKAETDLQSASQNLQSNDQQEALTGIQQVGNVSDEAAAKFEGLEPPSDYEDVQDRFVGALRNVGDTADAFEQAVDAGDKARADQTGEEFKQAIDEAERIGEEFDQQVGTS